MPNLPKRTLGRTGLEVTTLGFGAMELRSGVSDTDAAALLNAVLDGGINFIDTSIDYGESEAHIGKHIANRRSEYYLASKCGCVPGGGGGEHVHTAKNIREGVENSLRLLQTDYLDLVQFHRSLTQDEFEAQGALQEAMKLRDEGKVRFVGVSGTLPNLVEQIGMDVFDAFQIPYSALQRDHEDVIAQASEAGAGIIIRGGVARGAPEDWRGRRYYMIDANTLQSRWDEAKLDELLNGMSRVEWTLRFTLSHPDLSSTIVGTSNPDHLASNLAVAEKGPLPPELYERAKQAVAA